MPYLCDKNIANMKLFTKHLMSILTFLFICVIATNAQTTIQFKVITEFEEPNKKDDPDYGRRLPSRPIIAYIDFTNMEMTITGVNEDDIISYEIWSDDACLASTYDSKQLIDAILTTEENSMIIVINLPNRKLIGFYTR